MRRITNAYFAITLRGSLTAADPYSRQIRQLRENDAERALAKEQGAGRNEPGLGICEKGVGSRKWGV
eukprot:8783899-Alexandrium_andersonii.AAC.1